MRVLVILLLAACGESVERVEWSPAPADRSATFQGEALHTFCREQERQPGWTCDDFAHCETTHVEGGAVECHAKS